MGNIVQEEFDKLAQLILENKDTSEETKKDMQRIFYAGAIATHTAILKCSQSENSEKDLNEFFDSIHKKGDKLAGDKDV